MCVAVSAGAAIDSPNLMLFCSIPPESQSEESGSSPSGRLQPIPEDEQVEGSGGDLNVDTAQRKRSQFVKTQSIMMGVDRIDEYSQIEIQTP